MKTSKRWLAVLAMVPVLVVASGAAADSAYDPTDFKTVITTVYDPGATVRYREGDGNSPALITSTGALTGSRTLQVGRTSNGELVVLGTTASQFGESYLGDYGATGSVTVDEGGQLVFASILYLGYSRAANDGSRGELHIIDGKVTFNGRVTLPYNAYGAAVVTQSGGESIWNGDVRLGGFASNGDGRMEFSGGTATFNNHLYVGTATGSAAQLDVMGAGATIEVKGTARLYIYSGATLGFEVHSDGVSMIDVLSNLTTISGGTIDMSLKGFTPSEGQVFDLIRSTSLLQADVDKLAVSLANEGVWGLQLGQYNGVNTLQAKYLVPEPATMGLLGLGLVGLAIRRRH